MITCDSASSRVVAVIVTYHPKAEDLSNLLSVLLPQVARIVVVDNTLETDLIVPSLIEKCPLSGIHLIRLGGNFGVAKALNVGIDWAVEVGATHVLLSDQDSLPAADMIQQLLNVTYRLAVQGVRVACVAPAFRDLSTGSIHKFQVPGQGFFYTTCKGDQALPWTEVISNITSGSLIPVHVFENIGFMREDYFIDFVDTEWCFRARHLGYKLYGTSKALMDHYVGGDVFRAWCGGWRSFSGYSRERLYYQYRNAIFLLRGNLIPRAWQLRLIMTWFGNIYAYVFFAPHRFANLGAISRGLWHGVRGISGSFIAVQSRNSESERGRYKVSK
jgi:rhamnosyltransferase